jgi:hypothetical protein
MVLRVVPVVGGRIVAAAPADGSEGTTLLRGRIGAPMVGMRDGRGARSSEACILVWRSGFNCSLFRLC